MGGDAILHHPGNSTCVDYINKACWTWYDIRTWSATNEVYKVGACNYRCWCLSNKFCVMRQFSPFRVDSLIFISALQQEEDIFDYSGALLQPDNATFHLVWFTGREQRYHNRIYIRFEYPAPDLLCAHVACDRSRYLETWNFLTVVYWNGTYYRQILGHVMLSFSLCCVSF